MNDVTDQRRTTRGQAAAWAGLAGLFVFALATAACGGGAVTQSSGTAGPPLSNAGQAGAVVAFGDGVTAGVGLLEAQSWPSQIQARIDELGYNITIVNAGLPGDTASQALARIDDVLPGDARILILAIGAEDVRHGAPASALQNDLMQIIEHARARAVAVLLVGVKAPPSSGPDYVAGIDQVYQDLARQYRLVFVPDLLEGVAGRRDLLQPDGLTPNAEGARLIAERIWPALQPMIDNLGGNVG